MTLVASDFTAIFGEYLVNASRQGCTILLGRPGQISDVILHLAGLAPISDPLLKEQRQRRAAAQIAGSPGAVPVFVEPPLDVCRNARVKCPVAATQQIDAPLTHAAQA